MLVYFTNRPRVYFTKRQSRHVLRAPAVKGRFLESSLNAVLVFLCAVKTKRLHGAQLQQQHGPVLHSATCWPNFPKETSGSNPPHICSGEVLFAFDTPFVGLMRQIVEPWPLQLWGPLGPGCYIHPVLGTALSTNGPWLPQSTVTRCSPFPWHTGTMPLCCCICINFVPQP